MLASKSTIKEVSSQTPEEQMYLIKLIAHQMLGAKWMYYRKIKRGEKGLKLLKETSLMEQMKATRSALRFTTKNTKKLYRSAYQTCVTEIKKYTGIKEGFIELPEVEDGQEPPSLTSAHDATIITWTPLKFLTQAQKIRSKGLATQRHSEGLIAKLYFKVAAFYTIPRNWDVRKLTLYLRNITKESSYQDISAALDPLKSDLHAFSEVYESFKFGKASLSQDIASDTDAFDDAISVESAESQIKTLYWYEFIYSALELFIIKYYLIMVSSTSSLDAINYLTNIFEPALAKAVENRIVFEGSFETDRSKQSFRKPFEEYSQKMKEEPQKKKLKTKEGIFESYTYNLSLIEESKIDFDPPVVPEEDSAWGTFIKEYILALERPILNVSAEDNLYEDPDKLSEELDQIIDINTRSFVLTLITKTIINFTAQKRQARFTVLERFKARVKTEYELEVKRVAEIRKKSEKKLRELNKKLNSYKRLEQTETVNTLTNDIAKFEKGIEEKIQTIKKMSKEDLNRQKERLNVLFQEVNKDKTVSVGIIPKRIVDCVSQIETGPEFIKYMPDYLAKELPPKYFRDLEPFYKNLFSIFNLNSAEKLLISQSLEKTFDQHGIRLTLSDEDKQQFNNSIKQLKEDIETRFPDVFAHKVIFQTKTIPVSKLLDLSIDNKSLHNLLCLKIASSQTTQTINFKPEIIKAIVELNRLVNPIPKNHIGQSGKEKDKNYEKRINAAQLDSLLS